jgi:hypothetical protein
MVLRPTLLPGLVRVWRGSHTLQLGLDPARAVLVDLPDPGAARMLDLLDGSRSEQTVLAEASDGGVAIGDARELLTTLHAAGLVLAAPALLPTTLAGDERRRLIGESAALALRRTTDELVTGPAPAQILRRRSAARVVVAGRGRLGAGIAVALAEAGVRHVHPDLAGAVAPAELSGGPLRAADVGRPRAEAVTDAIHRASPETRTHPVRRTAPSLVVQLGHDQPVTLLAARHARRRQPHLAVTLREGVVVVGPFVPAAGGPCLNCLDLHRRERDAGWPEISARSDAATPEPCGVATVLAATAYATAEALAFLDGRPVETLGAAVRITAPGRFRRRSWPPHPECGCATRGFPQPSGLLVRQGANCPDSGG